MWRGPPLADFRYEPFAQAEIARLEEARLDCLEERIEADLALGQHAKLIGELEALTGEQPLQRAPARPAHARPLPLGPPGRRARGLPGDAPPTRRGARHRAERRAARAAPGDPAPGRRARPAASADRRRAGRSSEKLAPEPPSPVPAVRKTVTVLVAGSGGPRLLPSTRSCAGGWATGRSPSSAPVLERHGATVERLQDGRVMGVFGVPAAHEDDALRAVRAAVELRDAFAGRRRDPSHRDRFRGGADRRRGVGRAARHRQRRRRRPPLCRRQAVPARSSSARRPGALVRDAVTGRAARAPATARRRRPGGCSSSSPGAPPFLAALRRATGRPRRRARPASPGLRARALRERRAQLFTVFGEAGIGKTRLAAGARARRRG